MNIEIGKTYLIIHQRKGEFKLKVTDKYAEWITGLLVDEEDEELTMRESFISKAVEQ